MKLTQQIRGLSKGEFILWLCSAIGVAASFLLSGSGDPYTLIASLIGVTALIYVAKGYVLGQLLTVVFSVFYGIISFFFHYYGEMITYLCMTTPIAIASMIAWVKNPYKDTNEVKVSRLTKAQICFVAVGATVTTIAFYFILGALGNANLLFSTISVTTSFVAATLTLFRSPYYAVGYAANDIVLIVLWTLAAMENISYLPMVVCFILFFINDMYGFYNWRRMQKRQKTA